MGYVAIVRNVNEAVKKVIRLGNYYIVIPFSNSQAHRIAERYWGRVRYVNSIDEVIKTIDFAKKWLRDNGYSEDEISDIDINKPILGIVSDSKQYVANDIKVEESSEVEGVHVSFMSKKTGDTLYILLG